MQFHVIDDEPFITDLFSGLLVALGYEASTFNCPLKYLEYAKSDAYEKPVAIISDVKMPGMNGYEMIEQLKNIHPGLKCIFVSGEEVVSHPAIYDACMFFNKPIRLETLKNAVAAILSCQPDIQDEERCAMAKSESRLPIDWKCRHCPKAA